MAAGCAGKAIIKEESMLEELIDKVNAVDEKIRQVRGYL
jgi:hypothetical protein